MAVNAGLTIPDELSRQRPEARKAACDPGQQILRLLAEDEDAGAGARVSQARNDDPPPARLAMTDRHLSDWLPDVELADLPGPVDGPLKRPWWRREQRPHLTQIVIDDRLADRAAQRLEQLANPHPRQLRIVLQQPVDLRFERLEHTRLRRPLIPRRRLASQRAANRVARQPRRSRELLDRLAADEVLTSQLSPLLHTHHPLRRLLVARSRRGSAPPRTTPPTTRGGSVFARRRGVSFHAAPTSRAGATLRVGGPVTKKLQSALKMWWARRGPCGDRSVMVNPRFRQRML